MFDIVPDMARQRALLSPDAFAFHDLKSGTEWTFSEVNAAADAVAEGLTRAGLSEGDRLAILCQNRVEFFVTLFACQKTGIILCPLNWRQPAVELAETLRPVGALALLYDAANSELAGNVSKANNLTPIDIEGELVGWIKSGGPPRSASVPSNRPWYLLFTSGTTGTPKAVIQTATMCWVNAINMGQAVGLTSADRSVNFLPLFHTAGINLYTMALFLNGGSSFLLSKFDSDVVLNLIKEGKVTQFFGVPAIYQAFSMLPDIDDVDWTNVRCGCGGAPMPVHLFKFFAERGVHVLNGFGMTETGPTVFLMDAVGAADKIGSIGKAQSLTEVRLDGVEDDGLTTGEFLLRGPGITPGYFNNPKATKDAFTDDGWLKTGDVGRRDKDGYYYIVDRIKDMYISGGENVYPAEVERVLHSHPAVLEASVIGVLNEKWGEVGVAFVMLRPGQTLDTDKVRLWCRERLATYKVPVMFHIVDDFPRTEAGKVRKPDLRKRMGHA